MPFYQTPGVYVEEVDSVSKPIEAGATNTVGFLGIAEKGPVDEPVLITNWAHYNRVFGSMHSSGYLGHAVYLFFQNGGTKCYVYNLKKSDSSSFEHDSEQAASEGKSEITKSSKEKKEMKKFGNPDDLAKLIIGRDEGPGKRTGLFSFDEITDISIVAAPGVTDKASQDAILSHCEKNRFRIAILDAPENIDKNIDSIPMPRDSIMGAYYFPWVKMYDQVQSTDVYVPPSGGIAGIYGRVDKTRGVHKAPANEIYRGVTGLKYNITDGEQELLNPKGINCIRDFKGRGIRVWGARTFSSKPEWRYINVRRLFCMVEQAVQNGTNWVVFEPNTRDLWKKIVRNITAFLLLLWKDKALFGNTPEEAFFVRCDDELNPPESIDAGYVICEVGLAPAKPAEFVVFRIAQKALGREE
ncbi:MAG: phage tail sheath family protein [Spirochaetes bacterium]|nr:phage tail sheath family protein [Spirochaetota bacterium]